MNSTTTGTFLLASLSAMSSSVNSSNNHLFSEQELYAIELKYNAPESLEIKSDEYVSFAYNSVIEVFTKNDIDLKFMGVAQNFSEQQIELDDDFISALDSLFYNNNNPPLKKRF